MDVKITFDYTTYRQINSRIGRINKKLKTKTVNSNNYSRLEKSIRRLKFLQRKIVNTFTTDISKYVLTNNIELTIKNLLDLGIVEDNKFINDLLEKEWRLIQHKNAKYRRENKFS